MTPDVFEVIDWPAIFGVKATPLKAALAETFRHPTYSQIVAGVLNEPRRRHRSGRDGAGRGLPCA